jgi:deazaflavin-dependent oxidoreductase (nitroreductase family)
MPWLAGDGRLAADFWRRVNQNGSSFRHKGGTMSDMNDWNKAIIEEFRANGGKVGGQFEGAPLCLLTTTGAKSGNPHTVPVMYLPDGDRMVVFASKAGAPTNPDWYHNLKAHPMATVEVGKKSFQATATEETGDERERLFRKQAGLYPGFAEYQEKTTRQIPVVALRMAGQKPR